MPLISHTIQGCCKVTVCVKVVPEICTGATEKYTIVFHISHTKMNC